MRERKTRPDLLLGRVSRRRAGAEQLRPGALPVRAEPPLELEAALLEDGVRVFGEPRFECTRRGQRLEDSLRWCVDVLNEG